MARDFGSAESTEIAGILCVFPNFGTARMGQKTRHPAVAELFRGSLGVSKGHVSNVKKLYEAGGAASLKPKKRGRPAGKNKIAI